jgi:hypothetical protein
LCEYGPLDRTGEVKKEVDKIFASALKSKLSANQKNARKRVQKQEKETTKEAAKKSKGAKRGMALVIPPTVDFEQSSQYDYDLMRPMVQDDVPAPTKIGPRRQRRASRVQAGMTSKHGCLCNFVAKQLYMDNTLCEIQYHGMNHFYCQGQPCHGSSFTGFRHSLGAKMSW